MANPASLSAPRVVSAEPDLTWVQWNSILRALCWAFEDVREKHPGVLNTATEEEVSERLAAALSRRTAGEPDAPGMGAFETPARGAKAPNAPGRIEKAPDLTFRPKDVPREVTRADRWAAFVECKIVDGTTSTLRYCTQGVQRFVDGQYASWMPTAGMLGYVRDGQQPHAALGARFKHSAFNTTALTRHTDNSCTSTHSRATAEPPCVDITLIHLWLDAR